MNVLNCEVCLGPQEITCDIDGQPWLAFCAPHFIEHAVAAHGWTKEKAEAHVDDVREWRRSNAQPKAAPEARP